MSNSSGQATLVVTPFAVGYITPAIASTALVLETVGAGHNTTSTYRHSFSNSKAGAVAYRGADCTIAIGDGSVVAGSNSVALAVKYVAPASVVIAAKDRYGHCDFRVADGAGNVSAWHSVPYIKLDAAGNALVNQDISRGMSSEAWRCVQDLASDLIWEVKTTDSGLHDTKWTYTWYDSNPVTNGGVAGTENGGYCWANGSGCDTEKFVAYVNNTGLCGATTGWRMPTTEELTTLRTEGYGGINIDLFPNVQFEFSAGYWTSTTLDADFNASAWTVVPSGFSYNPKSVSRYVRLVRGGQ